MVAPISRFENNPSGQKNRAGTIMYKNHSSSVISQKQWPNFFATEDELRVEC